MFVNPFERMKKVREDKERVEKETQEEKERYARLGVQMGLTKSGGVVPSFMQNIISDEKKGSVPPFGMSEGADSYAPMPSSPSPKSSLSNDALKDLSLPGGGGAPQASPMPGMSDGPSFNPSDSGPSSMPMSDSHLPGNSFPSTPRFSSPSPIPSGGGSFPSSSQPSFSQDSTLETVRHDASFFDIEQNAIDQIEALLNLSAGNYFNSGDIEKVIESIKDPFSSKQLFALFGDLTETEEAATAVKAAIGTGSIDIEMKKMYSYTTPYLYVIKSIINGISKISVEDKRAL
ncbi:hypothetical protein Zmor_012277 [Zophobas morio]|uniref:Uncharacterized protein n=1 Tax=Zophobas morio TaxID=2755281 RepID=A0AA38HII1_9CUCU|nr:hypothetical protein Zmor_012277 [Zophobas morio]